MFQNNFKFNSSYIFVIILINVYYVTLLVIAITYNFETVDKLESKLSNLKFVHEELLVVNQELMNKTTDMRYTIEELKQQYPEPSLIYEKSRIRVQDNILNFWNLFRNKTRILITNYPRSKNDILKLRETVRQYKLSWLSDMEQLSRHDGYDLWRRNYSKKLKLAIYKNITKIQNPEDCENARILECVLPKFEGLGSTVHHISHCLVIAYHTKRTMVLNSESLSYIDDNFILPFSRTCRSILSKAPRNLWKGNDTDDQILVLDRRSRVYVSRKIEQGGLMRHIPRELTEPLLKITNEPFAWWTGQMIQQFIKFSPKILKKVNSRINQIDFSKPIVGIHVRTTDIVNLRNIKNVTISDFMDQVKEFYDQLEITEKVESRRVFIATDNPYYIEVLKKNYPNYKIFAHDEIAEIASDRRKRFTTAGLFGIIGDLRTLLKCDHVICTYSSNICRLVLEMSQAKFPDTISKVLSLDSIYFGTLNNYRTAIAVQNHTPIYDKELELRVGDKVKIFSFQEKHGHYHGENKRLKTHGFIPAFKIEFNSFVDPEIVY